MKRQDIYVSVFAIAQFILFAHAVSIFTSGAGLSLVGEKSFVGYGAIFAFVSLFGLIFSNAVKLVSAIQRTEDEALTIITKVGYQSTIILFLLGVLQLLNALALFIQYNTI